MIVRGFGRCLLGSGFILFLGNAAAAQQAADATAGTLVLDALIVEGDRVAGSAESAIARKREAPNAVTVIEAEQLNQFGDQPLGDALRRLPGVTFPGGNRARDLQLRAIGAEYTQVLVNGRPLIDGSSRRSVQVDRIPSSLVERVEIARSPLSSQDGQGAAGTLNIVLRNMDFTPRTELGLGAGYLSKNGATGDTTFLDAGSAGALRYVLSGGVQRQRRNESKDSLSFDGSGAPSGGVLGLNERTFDQINLTPAFEIQLGDNDVLRFEPSYLRTREDRDDVSRELTADQTGIRRREAEDRVRIRENFGVYSAWNHEISDDARLTVDIDAQKAREDTSRNATRYRADGTIDRRRRRSEDIDLTRLAPAVRMERRLGDHELAFGGDFSRATREEDNGEVTNGVPAAPNAARTYDIRETRWNGFVQDSWRIDDTTRLAAGLRLEQSKTRTEDASGSADSRSDVFVLPSLHLVHTFVPQTDLRMGIARTVRRPDLRELTPTISTQAGTIASPDIGGNPDIKPESIWGIDAGVDQYFYGRSGVFSVNLFARRFDDKIEFTSALEDGRYVSRPQNAGEGDLYGAEVEGRLPLAPIGVPDISLWGNATWVRTRLDAPTGERRRFLDQNDAVANVGLDWYVPAIETTFGISANWVSGYEQTVRTADGGRQKNEVDASTRVDLSARTQLGDGLSLSLSALNIFAETEKRDDRVLNAAGTVVTRTNTREDTYRAVYAKLNWAF